MKRKYDHLSWSGFERIVNRFVRECSRKGKHYDTILAIAHGGLMPAVMLSHRLGVPDIQIISIRRNTSNNTYSSKMNPIFGSFQYSWLRNRSILIVDDIAGTGGTLQALENKLAEHCIKDYEIFVLVKFRGSYTPPDSLKLDFYGKVCRNWVVFPWERKP